MEGKLDDISHFGSLKIERERETVSATISIKKDWLPNDVGRIKEEGRRIVADADLIGGYRGGPRGEQSDSAEQCESREHHGVLES